MNPVDWLLGKPGILLTASSLTVLASWFIHRGLSRWRQSVNPSIRQHLYEAIHFPATVFPVLLCVIFLMHEYGSHDEGALHDLLGIVESVLSVLFPAWVALRLIKRLPALSLFLGINGLDRHASGILSRFFQVLIFIIAGLILAQELGYSLSALLTFGGIGGIVVGLAAKDWLSNFFGGLMLMLDRPFKEGDWVRSPDREIEGHVEQIGWRFTQIRNFDRRPLFVPNSVFTSIVIENPSKMRNRRLIENFGIRYEDLSKVEVIMKDIMQAFENHEELDCNEPYYARLVSYGDSALDCQIRVHVIPTGRVDFVRVRESVLLMIARVVEQHGAEFAYPVVRYIKD